MKKIKILATTLAMMSVAVASSAHAGPTATIFFKNLSSLDAVYSPTNANEGSTRINASPKPDPTVKPRDTVRYHVLSPLSPDTNFALVRYTIGRKTCAFSTTFTNTYIHGGVKVPKWTKNANASGGATCTATITQTKLSDFSWTVEFTMK